MKSFLKVIGTLLLSAVVASVTNGFMVGWTSFSKVVGGGAVIGWFGCLLAIILFEIFELKK